MIDQLDHSLLKTSSFREPHTMCTMFFSCQPVFEGPYYIWPQMMVPVHVIAQASPMVQVDEMGENVRPNHSRCIIILREVPETTPVEEVEAIFKSVNCPRVLSIEFAHNSNWYITFQSDMDALQALQYLREEVKTFQGKPIMARIKAINTSFGKNGFRGVDSSVYSQPAQPQGQYGAPVYIQPMYSAQQQYPVYPVVSQSWNPPVVPYFETPLAPIPNNGHMNGYNSSGNYKTNSSSQRPINRNRNHRAADCPLPPSLTLTNNLPSAPLGPQNHHTSGAPSSEPVSLLSLSPKETFSHAHTFSGDPSGIGRGRRGNYRGIRRKDDHHVRPVPLMEAKVTPPPPPDFELEASNFPPLPGSVVSDGSRGETIPEMRLSDVVRGLKVTNKPVIQETTDGQCTKVSEDPVSVSDSVDAADEHAAATLLTVSFFSSCVLTPVPEEDKDEPPNPESIVSSPTQTVSPTEQTPSSTLSSSPSSSSTSSASSSSPPPSCCSQSPQTETPSPSPSSPTSELVLRKLSYAEVCQKLAKDKPQMTTPSPPASTASQPLQELKVNGKEDSKNPGMRRSAEKPEKNGDGRPPRQPLRSFRGGNRQIGAGEPGPKFRENYRDTKGGKQFIPQRGSRRSGKEQNIPPTSQK
ncbi:la-related protein 4 isoform X2 [Cynoglossus semilaevis]|uniref:la-related protein 4 isoform X2 n=1 Tax=Cynoglossus semilaevis TaxID=244447 RepID=UPI0007DCA3B4|nr:la-related protein 4-like isoform X2 [Cynoglossus semilaevis]